MPRAICNRRRRVRGGHAAWVVLSVVLVLCPGVSRGEPLDTVSDRIRNRIEASHETGRLPAGRAGTYAVESLRQFYEERLFQPLWIGPSGPSDQAEVLLASIREVDQQGLFPSDYHLRSIESALDRARNRAQPPDVKQLADLDLLLSDAFLILGRHLQSGRVDPATIDSEWHVESDRRKNLFTAMEQGVRAGTVREALESFRPRQRGYARLEAALARYRTLAAQGGWRVIPEGVKLEKGVRDPRVARLRRRLETTGDLLPSKDVDDELFDEPLAAAVQAFQSRHGLGPDGVVGPRTLAALNVSAAARARQIELNLERWRWLPDDLGPRYLLVNIPNFELWIVENDIRIKTHRVVVGKPVRRTPVFSSKMTYLVLSPFWHVPPTIATQDVLPETRKDVDYLLKKNIRVFQGWGGEAREIDPTTIDWSKVTAKNLPYRFRQDPGAQNALGTVKFMFPNPYHIYLHDTPSKELFVRPDRSFSSGCIRVQDPIDLAIYVLGPGSRWNRETLLAAIATRVEQTVRLPDPIDVHLLYWTAWIDPDGTVQFRNDVYDRDRPLDQALHEKPPVEGP